MRARWGERCATRENVHRGRAGPSSRWSCSSGRARRSRMVLAAARADTRRERNTGPVLAHGAIGLKGIRWPRDRQSAILPNSMSAPEDRGIDLSVVIPAHDEIESLDPL